MYPNWVHFFMLLAYNYLHMKFAPLHIVTGYSFLQSGLTMEKVIRGIKSNDFFGAAISDNETLFGLPEFAKEIGKLNKPYLLGESVVINNDTLCLYVMNEDGYKNLMAINLEIQQGELTLSFLAKHSTGLVAILETSRGAFKENFLNNFDTTFKKYLLDIAKPYGDNFYLGIEVTSKEDVSYANKIRHFADEFTYTCVAFPRIRYEKKDDAIVTFMVEAIANDQKIQAKKAVGQEYFMKEEDYAKIYSKVEMENTIKIIKQSNFSLANKRGELLHYPVEDSKKELERLCYKALEAKGLTEEKYQSRLKYELDIICSMGFADYFLIVQDYVNYAKTHDIVVGPGRGSSAGSLVSYLLNIIEINPLDYDLQFERFLNPHRKTMPDIDIDFMDNKRDEMVQYMREKYGNNRVASIVTFQTIGAKQSLRDVGRIYNYPSHHIDLLSKKLTNKDYDLRESYKKLPDFKSLIDSDSYFLEIVSLASKIEGLPRQSGVHAAGIVLNDKPLEESIPVTILPNGNYISQYEAEYLEAQGLLKMDFLALSNLTIIDDCLKLIKQRDPSFNLTPYTIPYQEEEIFDLIRKNKTMGLFQIDTMSMRREIQILKPKTFEDIVALLALDRPATMQYTASFANRRDGKEKVNYISNDIKEVLESTYGIILYQEQVNMIVTKMAGFSLAEADVFRRAISKKNKDVILNAQKQFLEGAMKKGYTEGIARKVFADILKFAEYGFNKSHSVVYSVIACRMAYLKIHYPLEFYVALLGNSGASSDSKFNDYISEMKSLGIKMLPPSINYSSYNFVIKDNGILFPLLGIKDINISMMDKIDQERKEHGPFTNFFNFALRMFPKGLTANHMQALISSGAFDELYPSRASMRLSTLSALQYGELNRRDDGQLSIGIEAFPEPMMSEAKDDPLENLYKEYEVLGVMLSDNPLSYKKELLEKKGAIPISEAKEMNESLIAGIINNKKVINTKKGGQMSFVKLFDESGDIEVIVFSDLYDKASKMLTKNNIVLMKIRKQINKGEETYIAQEIERLEESDNA